MHNILHTVGVKAVFGKNVGFKIVIHIFFAVFVSILYLLGSVFHDLRALEHFKHFNTGVNCRRGIITCRLDRIVVKRTAEQLFSRCDQGTRTQRDLDVAVNREKLKGGKTDFGINGVGKQRRQHRCRTGSQSLLHIGGGSGCQKINGFSFIRITVLIGCRVTRAQVVCRPARIQVSDIYRIDRSVCQFHFHTGRFFFGKAVDGIILTNIHHAACEDHVARSGSKQCQLCFIQINVIFMTENIAERAFFFVIV